MSIWGRRELPHPQTKPLGISPSPNAWGKTEETILWGWESAGLISHQHWSPPPPPALRTSPKAQPLVELPLELNAPQPPGSPFPLGDNSDWKAERGDLHCCPPTLLPCPPCSSPTLNKLICLFVLNKLTLKQSAFGPSGERPLQELCRQEKKASLAGEALLPGSQTWFLAPGMVGGYIQVLGSQLWFQSHLHH